LSDYTHVAGFKLGTFHNQQLEKKHSTVTRRVHTHVAVYK